MDFVKQVFANCPNGFPGAEKASPTTDFSALSIE
jgi:hypothetical protein